MSVLNQMFTSADMDELRCDLLGASATATFYSVTPSEGEVEIKQLFSGWHLGRKLRQPNRDVSGAVTMYLAGDVALDVESVREQAVVKLKLDRNDIERVYKIAEITPTQQIGGGYVLHCEPVDNTI